MVQDQCPAGEDHGGIGDPGRNVAAAGFALEFVAQVAQPAEGEFAGVALRRAEGAAAPDGVEPAEERSGGSNHGGAGGQPGHAGTVPDVLAEAAAVVRHDAEAAALGGRSVRPERGIQPHGIR
ncbi:hypothetical protein D9M72_417810 [compost metagenome]